MLLYNLIITLPQWTEKQKICLSTLKLWKYSTVQMKNIVNAKSYIDNFEANFLQKIIIVKWPLSKFGAAGGPWKQSCLIFINPVFRLTKTDSLSSYNSPFKLFNLSFKVIQASTFHFFRQKYVIWNHILTQWLTTSTWYSEWSRQSILARTVNDVCCIQLINNTTVNADSRLSTGALPGNDI